jgi:hypothetical protein
MKEDIVLIAEFMRWEWLIDYKHMNFIYKKKVIAKSPFNHDWSWLMPVVKEIYNTELPNEDSNYIGDITEALLDVDIQSLHKTVIEFIKWYNLNK